MSLLDWLIVIVPVIFVLGIGVYSRRFINGVADYLAAGRLCGRYVICVGDVANALSIIGLTAYVEMHYKTGFALSFWSGILAPLSIILGLTGYCTYRFRETKAMSLGQFLEMRYNRPFRIFASGLRSVSEMLANMIMPALAARFFIYFLDLPRTISVFGWFTIPSFMLIVVLTLVIAISLICMGGTLALVITDTVQGMFCYPLLVLFIIFILCNFSWSKEILPVMTDRAAGESFLNPFDVSNLRDFNLFSMVIMAAFVTVLHRASWTGAGTASAAKSPHEQKMAALLGGWRGAITAMFYLLIAVTIITMLNHANFANRSKEVRVNISDRIANELVADPELRKNVLSNIDSIPVMEQRIGVDAPLSQTANLDTIYLGTVHKTLVAGMPDNEGEANDTFQQFRTLYHQLTMAMTMRHLLPMGMLGLFCLLMVLAMISTDDTRIYSAALTVAQDVILPLKKKPFSPLGHVWMIRFVSIGVGVFFCFGSAFMAQMDYINMYVALVCNMWLGGCGPVMVFGLYSRFGTTAGAFTSLITGVVLSVVGVFFQQKWADLVYPSLKSWDMVDGLDKVLRTASGPMEPWVSWRMDAVKFPINSYEFYFITMLITLTLYIVVSYLTLKEPFNLERMLHRGKYSLDGERVIATKWTLRTVFSKLIGITPEYTRGDRFIAWAIFLQSFVYSFLLCFVGVYFWNQLSPWPIAWWGHYFFVVSLLVPGIIAAISTVWFGIGGAFDLVRLFRDLRARVSNPLDDGRVEGNMSLADKAQLEALDKKK